MHWRNYLGPSGKTVVVRNNIYKLGILRGLTLHLSFEYCASRIAFCTNNKQRCL